MKYYKEYQYDHQVDIVKSQPEWFGNDGLGGEFKGHNYDFILQNGLNNLFPSLRAEREDDRMNVAEYFRANRIDWWSGDEPTGHLCSSQIACLNHLFPLRYDPDAVLALANGAIGCRFFDGVEPIGCDSKFPGYIAFEVISNTDHLNESNGAPLTRGSMCTSVDAVILAKKEGKVWLLPIEWKFVERYDREDKSANSFDRKSRRWRYSGSVRLDRYSELINESAQLKSLSDYHGSIYFQEPFYQLMRQTLWAEQVLINHDPFFPGVEEFLHVHVVPDADEDLLERRYRNVSWNQKGNMEETWKACLDKPDKYHRVDPKSLFKYMLSDEKFSEKYANLLNYLEIRYWQ